MPKPEPLFHRDSPEQHRDLATRSLSVRAETIDESTRSIEAVMSTENIVQVWDWGRFAIIDEILLARGADLPDQVVLLENHSRYSLDDVLGSVRQMRVDGRQTVGRLFFAREDDRAESAWRKYRDGHARDVSVGYRQTEYVDLKPGERKTIAGKEYRARDRVLRVTTKWQVRELSVTPIGADEAAKTRSVPGPTPTTGGKFMNPRLRKYLESLGLRSEATDEQAQQFQALLSGRQSQIANILESETQSETAGFMARAALKELGVDPDDPSKPLAVRSDPSAGDTPPPPVDATRAQHDSPTPPPVDADTIRAEERARFEQIQQIGGDDLTVDQVRQAVREGWDEARVARQVLDNIRSGRTQSVGAGPAIHSRDHDTDCTREALSYGLMLRGSLRTIDPNASEDRRREQERLSDQGERFTDMSLMDVCREAVRLDGGRPPHSRSETIRAAVSGGTLSYVFTTSAYAALMAGYEEAPDTTDWCSVEDLPNFLIHDAILMGKGNDLAKLPRGDKAKDSTISDVREQYRLYRYARRFVVDEQDILDDRLSAISGTVPREMGLAAARVRPDLVYSELLANEALSADSTALFHADHSNLDSNALSQANLPTGVTAMGQQAQGGVRLNIRPRYLIVPGDLEFTARELLTSNQIVITGSTDDVRGIRNVIADLNLQLRVEGRIDATGVTDPDSGTPYTGSATNWFLASAPGKTIHVVYRAGTGRRPVMRTITLTDGQWGIGWDINLDIGVKALDFRGLYQGNS